MSLLRVLIIVGFLLLSSGVELADARPLSKQLEAVDGSTLVIPCVISMDELSGANWIKLEWGMTPEKGGPYRSILQRSDIKLQPEMHEEDCSLVISPVLQKDSGTYDVHLIVNNVQREPFQRVKVHVIVSTLKTNDTKAARKRHRRLRTHTTGSSVTDSDGSVLFTPATIETSKKSGSLHIDSDVRFLARTIHDLKVDGAIPFVATLSGLILLILVLTTAAGCYFGIQYCQDRVLMMMAIKAMEEGHAADQPTLETNSKLSAKTKSDGEEKMEKEGGAALRPGTESEEDKAAAIMPPYQTEISGQFIV